MQRLHIIDPEAALLLDGEKRRQISTIELIASENFVYPTILEVQGSILTNKYAEGYPGRRYHGGCEYIDGMESLAIERAKTLFEADHANVQPHSGVSANLAALSALLEPGDRILGMKLKHGGHLSHGSGVSITGTVYSSHSYGVNRETELLDYEEIDALAGEHKPKLIIAGGSAYPREIDFARIREIADRHDAYLLVDMAHIAGLVAAKIHPSPVPFADIVTTTTTKTLRGARGGVILCKEQYTKKVDKAVFPGTQGGPILQNVLAKAVTFKIAATEGFADYQRRVVRNAQCLAAHLADQGFRIVTGGTDNHLMLVDLRPKDLTGDIAEKALEKIGITVNKNMIPYDPQPPTKASGIRIGTPAVTSRGFEEEDISHIGELIGDVLSKAKTDFDPSAYREKVAALCRAHPLYLDHLEIPVIEGI
jgi:glycine hydroxymethyltransferase